MPAPASWSHPLSDGLPTAWAQLVDADTLARIDAIGQTLGQLATTEDIVPHPHHVFRALTLAPEDVSVIIVGQDPYPTPGHATGWAFSIPDGVWPPPPTLKNILRELSDDQGFPPPQHGNLAHWHSQGVLLLNRHLTTRAQHPAAHSRLGWSEVTDRFVSALAAQSTNRVAILWGAHARTLTPLLGQMPTIHSAHPSPLSAHRGFFGSRPFSRANQYLGSMGREPIDWSLGPAPGCQPG